MVGSDMVCVAPLALPKQTPMFRSERVLMGGLCLQTDPVSEILLVLRRMAVWMV